jgi:hypothetical protein
MVVVKTPSDYDTYSVIAGAHLIEALEEACKEYESRSETERAQIYASVARPLKVKLLRPETLPDILDEYKDAGNEHNDLGVPKSFLDKVSDASNALVGWKQELEERKLKSGQPPLKKELGAVIAVGAQARQSDTVQHDLRVHRQSQAVA